MLLKSIAAVPTIFLAAILAMTATTASVAAERRVVKSGGEVALMVYSAYGEKCKSLKATVVVVKAPKHGSLRQSSGFMDPYKSKATNSWESPCSGHRIRATVFHYKAKKGFRGKDRVVLRMIADRVGDASDHFDITVE